jgi:outer membrane lipase/esterase
MKNWKLLGIMLASVGMLVACGGGGGSASSSSGITTVKVVGDSLADSGVFGFKWAMQGNATDPMSIWTERLASAYGATLCPRYIGTSATSAVLNPSATACTSYAIGGGRINAATQPTSPFSIPQQLKDLALEKTYGPGDLLLVDGGGNDAADVVGAYLAITTSGPTNYINLLSTLLPSASVTAALGGGASTTAQIGGAYMQALADKFYADIKTHALDRGATRVAVLNMPGITNTPRFQDTLNLVALGAGGGATGAATRSATEAVIKGWVEAFNARLASKFAGDSRVLVIDFYTPFNDQIANPAQYGLTNVTTPACPRTGTGPNGTGSDGLPEYSASTCTATSLSAQTPPSGATGGANWWKTYLFSDGFHPTNYGYQLLAQLVAKSLATKGWI